MDARDVRARLAAVLEAETRATARRANARDMTARERMTSELGRRDLDADPGLSTGRARAHDAQTHHLDAFAHRETNRSTAIDARMLFGVVFAKKSVVVSSDSFARPDETRWTLDLTNAGFPYVECRDVCLFMPTTQRA